MSVYRRETSKSSPKSLLAVPGSEGMGMKPLTGEMKASVAKLTQKVRENKLEDVQAILNKWRLHPQSRRRIVNHPDKHSLSALHYAAKFNNADIIRLLLQCKADPNKVTEDVDKMTPLHFISRWVVVEQQHVHVDQSASSGLLGGNCVDSMHALLSNGAEINRSDAYGQTALHHAVQRGNIDAVRELMHLSNLQVDATDKQGQNALHIAALRGDNTMIELLLKKGISPFSTDLLGSSALHLAAQEGYVDIAKQLIKTVTQTSPAMLKEMVNAQDGDGCTILHLAVDNGHLEMVKFCLQAQASINHTDSSGDTALHYAASKGHKEIVQFLVEEAKADINVIDDEGETPLHAAARLDRHEVVEYLVQQGADIDLQNSDGLTPLMKAASWGQDTAVDMLLHLHAKISITDVEDRSVVWHAAFEDHISVIKALSQHPYFTRLIDQPDQYGNTPLHNAASLGFTDLVSLLLDLKAKPDVKNDEEMTPLHLACKAGHPRVAKVLIKRSYDLIEDEDELGNKPLHLAGQHGHFLVAQTLLDLGALVHARNASDWTPLDCAAGGGWKKTCEVLLDSDAPVDPKDKRKRTPLHIAAKEGHTKVVLLLLENGANIQQCDDTGRNCLDLAIDNNQKEVARALIEHPHWRDALRNVHLVAPGTKASQGATAGSQTTPILKLIRRMPDIAERVFTRCMVPSPKIAPDHEDYYVDMDYEFLDCVHLAGDTKPVLATANQTDDDDEDDDEAVEAVTDELVDKMLSWDDWDPNLDSNHPLKVMVLSKRESLLAHPLVTSILEYKWDHFARYIYYFNICLFIIFLSFLTAIASSSTPEKFATKNTTGSIITSCSSSKKGLLFFSRGIVIIISLVRMLVFEGIELVVKRWKYLSLENVCDWLTYFTSILFAWDFSENNCVANNWQWQCGIIAIWMSWLTFILFLRRSAYLGIYVVMFAHVLHTFMRFSIIVFLFVVAYAVAFYMLFENTVSDSIGFSTPGRALVKTMTMLTGEFEYDSIFASRDNPLQFEGISYLIWIVFLVMLPIILMNMLVGLAVDDIKGVQESANLKRLAMQVELILDFERRVSAKLRTRLQFVVRFLRYYPNQKPSLHARIRGYFFSAGTLNHEKVVAALNPQETELDRLEAKNAKLRSQVKELRVSMKVLHSDVGDMKAMLRSIMIHHNLKPAEED